MLDTEAISATDLQGARASGVIFTDKFAPHPGGTAVIYHNWVKHMSADRLAVVTCSIPGIDHRPVDLQLDSPVYRVPFINIPKLRMPLCWLFIFLASFYAVLKERPAVFHAGQPLETGWIAWFWSRICRKPYILHCFGDDIPYYWSSRWVGWIMRFLARQADRITVISRYSAEKLRALGLPDERISIVYPAVEWFAMNTTAEYDPAVAHNGRRMILTVGRLVERKGHDRVIATLPRILTRVPDAEYVIVGSGPDEARLRRLVQECGLGECVRFVGSVPHEATRRYYERAEVFVHPNRQLASGEVEGFGMVFLEAGACGVPVVGGNSGGTPDAVCNGVTGFLVDPNNIDEIADRIIALLVDTDLRNRMGEAGKQWAAQFSWDRAAKQIWNLSCSIER